MIDFPPYVVECCGKQKCMSGCAWVAIVWHVIAVARVNCPRSESSAEEI